MSNLDLDEMLKREALAVRRVPELDKQLAAEYLREKICGQIPIFRRWMHDWGLDWAHKVVGWHFRGGMAIRNLLRDGGFGEEDLGIENLDYIYTRLVERAVLGKELDRDDTASG